MIQSTWLFLLDILKLPCVILQSLSCVQLFMAPWAAARQAPLPSTVSQRLLTFMSGAIVFQSQNRNDGGNGGNIRDSVTSDSLRLFNPTNFLKIRQSIVTPCIKKKKRSSLNYEKRSSLKNSVSRNYEFLLIFLKSDSQQTSHVSKKKKERKKSEELQRNVHEAQYATSPFAFVCKNYSWLQRLGIQGHNHKAM